MDSGFPNRDSAAGVIVLAIQTVRAASATWNLNPVSNDWNTAENWTPATVPIGFSDTATFDVSNTTSISISIVTEIGTIVFNPSASVYTLTGTNFKIGVITNNSGISQTFSGSTTLEGAATGPNSFVGNLTLLEGHANAGVSSFTGNVVLFADVTDVANAKSNGSDRVFRVCDCRKCNNH